MKKQNTKTTFLKEDLIWHYISLYLDSLISSVTIKDNEFLRLFQCLRDYVDTKLHTDVGGDILDVFVIVEKEIN